MRKNNDFLQKVTILEECFSAERAEFGTFLKPCGFKEKELIFRQDDPGRTLYIVRKGTVGTYKKFPDGTQMELGRFSPGMFLGEMALLEAQPRSITSYAVTDAELLKMDMIDFYRFIWIRPAIGVKILKAMSRYMILHLRDADNFLTSMAMWGETARHRAITDELTGLYNKRFFEESLEINLSKYRNIQRPFSLIYFDIDDFRQINDQFNLHGGDLLIKTIGKTVKSVCPGEIITARLGGDEFALLLPGLSAVNAAQVAANFQKALRKKEYFPGWCENPPTISIGIAEFPKDGKTGSELKDSADKALYRAKASGKNNIKCFGE